VILRATTVYGPGATFVEDLLLDALERPWISAQQGHAMGAMQGVHVRDMADAVVLAGTRSGVGNLIVNVAGGRLITMQQVGRYLRALVQDGAGWRPEEHPHGQPVHMLRFDITRMRERLGHVPQVRMSDALAEMLDHLDMPRALEWASGGGGRRQLAIGRDPYRSPARAATAGGSARELSSAARWDDARAGDADGSFALRMSRIYDQLTESDHLHEYYGGSGFINWGYWTETTTGPREACEQLVEELVGYLPEPKGPALDVACGEGATTAYLLKYFDAGELTGINVSRRQLELCRQRAPRCTFLEMDATDLDFDDESFEVVFCVDAAVHFDTRKRFFEEAFRVLRPGGRLVLSEVLCAEDSPIQPAANYLPDPSAYADLLEETGYRRVEVVDATEECWGSFVEDHSDWLRRRLVLGRMVFPEFAMAMQFHDRMRVECYVLAGGEKPPTARVATGPAHTNRRR
jgi:MPBQ/MSBQ methyltransferase